MRKLTYQWNIDVVIIFTNIEIQNSLVHVLNNLKVKLQIHVIEFVIKLQKSTNKLEAWIYGMIFEDRSNKLSELFVSDVLDSISIHEVLISPLK